MQSYWIMVDPNPVTDVFIREEREVWLQRRRHTEKRQPCEDRERVK